KTNPPDIGVEVVDRSRSGGTRRGLSEIVRNLAYHTTPTRPLAIAGRHSGAVAFLRSRRRALWGRWPSAIDPTAGKHFHGRLATATRPPTSSFAGLRSPAP